MGFNPKSRSSMTWMGTPMTWVGTPNPGFHFHRPRLLEKRMVLLRFGQGLLRLVLLLMWTIRLTGKRFGSTSLEPWTLLILKIPERYPVRASSLQCFRKYSETWRCIAIYLRRMILQNCYFFFYWLRFFGTKETDICIASPSSIDQPERPWST